MTNKISGVSGTSVSGGTLASIGTDSESGKLILQANKNHATYKVDTKWEIDVLGGNMRLVCYGPTSSPKTTTPISITPDANIGELGAKFKAIDSSIAAKRNTADCSSLYTSIQNQLNGSTTSGLLTKINGKADTGHTHTQYAAVNHTHDYTTTSTCKTRYTELKNSLGNSITTIRQSIAAVNYFYSIKSDATLEQLCNMVAYGAHAGELERIVNTYGKSMSTIYPSDLSSNSYLNLYGDWTFKGITGDVRGKSYLIKDNTNDIMFVATFEESLSGYGGVMSLRRILKMSNSFTNNMRYMVHRCPISVMNGPNCGVCPWYKCYNPFLQFTDQDVQDKSGPCFLCVNRKTLAFTPVTVGAIVYGYWTNPPSVVYLELGTL